MKACVFFTLLLLQYGTAIENEPWVTGITSLTETTPTNGGTQQLSIPVVPALSIPGSPLLQPGLADGIPLAQDSLPVVEQGLLPSQNQGPSVATTTPITTGAGHVQLSGVDQRLFPSQGQGSSVPTTPIAPFGAALGPVREFNSPLIQNEPWSVGTTPLTHGQGQSTPMTPFQQGADALSDFSGAVSEFSGALSGQAQDTATTSPSSSDELNQILDDMGIAPETDNKGDAYQAQGGTFNPFASGLGPGVGLGPVLMPALGIPPIAAPLLLPLMPLLGRRRAML